MIDGGYRHYRRANASEKESRNLSLKIIVFTITATLLALTWPRAVLQGKHR